MRIDDTRIPKSARNWTPPERTKTIRPKQMWFKDIKETMRVRTLGPEEWN